jgi:GTPase SAR1 family protein
MTKEIKIVFAGLEQGGKTSIIRTLERKKYVVEELKPTKGVERCQINVLDCVINEWDFGGQAEFRSQYLEKKEIQI